ALVIGLRMPSQDASELSQAQPGSRVRVESLPEHPHLRQRLLALGIRPGAQLEVLRRGRPGGILHLAHGLFEFMLRHDHAAEIAISHEPAPAAETAAEAGSPPTHAKRSPN
ncbi:MAG: FeoA family protein, partial [Synechococcaceae cyanobacterium]|nr:FeoA family protein [Synechococcaceae cyanobacterium]